MSGQPGGQHYREDDYLAKRMRYAPMLEREGLPQTAAKVRTACFREIFTTLFQEAGEDRATRIVLESADVRYIYCALFYASQGETNRDLLITALIAARPADYVWYALDELTLTSEQRYRLRLALGLR